MLSCRLHSYLRFSATFLVNTWPILILRSSPKVYLIIICAISVFTHTQLFLKFKNCQGVFLQYGNNNIHLVRLWGFFCFFINLFIYLFIFGCVGSSFLCEGFLQLRQAGATPHLGARASHYRGLSRCRAQAPDAQAQQLWLTGLVAPRHVGSSQTRARTCVPCIGRQILNHCATREAPRLCFESEIMHINHRTHRLYNEYVAVIMRTIITFVIIIIIRSEGVFSQHSYYARKLF